MLYALVLVLAGFTPATPAAIDSHLQFAALADCQAAAEDASRAGGRYQVIATCIRLKADAPSAGRH